MSHFEHLTFIQIMQKNYELSLDLIFTRIAKGFINNFNVLPFEWSLNIPKIATDGGPAPNGWLAGDQDPSLGCWRGLRPLILDTGGGLGATPSTIGGGGNGYPCFPCCCPILHSYRDSQNNEKTQLSASSKSC